MRSIRGGRSYSFLNRVQHAVDVVKNFFVLESQRCHSVAVQKQITVVIVFQRLAGKVHSAVEFYHEPRIGAVKVCTVRTDALLPAEFIPEELTMAKMLP